MLVPALSVANWAFTWYNLWCWKGERVGVIDAIADGCLAVVRRPWVIAPVVTLDLLYWVGGRLTLVSFTDGLIRLLEFVQQQASTAPDSAETIASLRTFGQQTDLLGLLSVGQQPLLLALDTTAAVGRPWGVGTIDVGNWALVVVLGIALLLLGVFWLALSLSLLAPLVRQEPFSLSATLRQVPRRWLRLLGLYAIIVGGFALVFLPLLIVATILSLLGLGAVSLLFLLALPLLVLYIYLALAPEAIVVSDVGPLRAIKLSVQVVRRNFWPTFGLLAATYIITAGFPYGWRLLTPQAAGVPLAIVANGLLVTGLATAAMLFYRERVESLEAAQAPAAGMGPPK